MKLKDFLKRAGVVTLAAVVTTSALSLPAFAAEKSDPEYIDKNVSVGNPDFKKNNLNVIKAVAEGLFAHEESIDISEYGISTDDVGAIYDAVLSLYPDIFFVDRKLSYLYAISGEKSYIKINPKYLYSESEVNTMLSDFYKEADFYLDQVQGELSVCKDNFSKALLLHDEIVLDAQYVLENSNYEFMINKQGLCENYSRVYAYLLSQIGIYSEIVDSETHEWVKVRMDDGNYYNVDVTWDDPLNDKPGRANHNYFLISDDKLIVLDDEDNSHDGYKAINSSGTAYDNYEYHSFTSKLCKLDANKTEVYAIGENGIVKYDYKLNTTTEVLTITDKWSVQDKPGYTWNGIYSGLDTYDGLLYYNTADRIYSYDPKTGKQEVVFTKESYQQDLYGLRIRNGVLYGIFAEKPNASVDSEEIKQLAYTVTFDPNNKGQSDIFTQTVTAGKTAKLPAEPKNQGNATLNGWFYDANDLEEQPFDFDNTPITEDVFLTARWTYYYSVSVGDVEHATVYIPEPSYKEYSIVQFTVTPDPGYVVDQVTAKTVYEDGTEWNIDPITTSPDNNQYSFDILNGDVVISVTTRKDFSDHIGEHLAGHSLSLEGNIGVNFYMELDEDVVSDENAYMQFTLPNGTTQNVKVSEASKDSSTTPGTTYYVFRCDVAAKEMNDTIKAQIIVDEYNKGEEYEYTVKEYADYLIEHSEVKAYAEAAELVKAMLNYGAYSQNYFNYNLDKLANEGTLTEEQTAEIENVKHTTIDKAYDKETAKLPDGVSFDGANLELESETILNLYFTNTTGKTLTFTDSKGNVLVQNPYRSYTQVVIPGIAAQDLDDDFTVNISVGDETGYSVQYSPLTYCYNVLARQTTAERTDTLKDLVKALYIYNSKANNYFNNIA